MHFWSWPPKLTDSGLLIVSKYPIIHHRVKPYNLGVRSDKLANKAAVWIRVALTTSTKPEGVLPDYILWAVTHCYLQTWQRRRMSTW